MGASELWRELPEEQDDRRGGLSIEGLQTDNRRYVELSMVAGELLVNGSVEDAPEPLGSGESAVSPHLGEPTDAELDLLEREDALRPDVDPKLDASYEDPVRQYLNRIGAVDLLEGREEEVSLAMQIEAGLLAKERYDQLTTESQTGAAPLTDPQLLRDLLRLHEQGKQAKTRFIEANLRWVVTVAKSRHTRSMPLLDCIQLGNEGLIRAVEMFDYKKGRKFSTYSKWWIVQKIQYGARREGRSIRLPKEASLLVVKFVRAKETLTQTYEREPTLAEIGQELDLSEEQVAELARYATRPASLDKPVNPPGGATLGDFVEDAHAGEDLERMAEAIDRQRLIEAALDSLGQERNAQIVRLHHGLTSQGNVSYAEIATQYNLSEGQVRNIVQKTRRLLRPILAEKGLGW